MMKKLFTLFIIGMLATMALSSCSGEAEDVDSVNKQTLLAFYPWTGGTNTSGLKSDLENNIDSICMGIYDRKGLNNTRVMVFFSDNYNTSTLYDLQYDETTKTVTRVPVKTYEGTIYSTADGIAEILNEVKQDAPALNYALIIGAHGCGWTYASDWVRYPYYARPRTGKSESNNGASGNNNGTTANNPGASASNITDNFSGIQFGEDPNRPLTRFFGSVSYDEAATDVTTLAEGIKKSGIGKMQYILFDACYMGNVETAYELKDVTNFMISSSSEIMQYGLPYRSLWTYLNSATPNYSSIVSGAISYYKSTDVPYLNLAVIDCRQLESLASLMKEINSKYSLSSTVPLDSIQPLDGFSPNLFYDLSVYVDSLHLSGYDKDQFANQLKKTIKAASSTEKVFTALSSYQGSEITIKSYCGLSISDPSQHSVAIKGREKTGWWKATH